jgi:predicted nuclease of restriction endonuclease-like (RecB) superfamily
MKQEFQFSEIIQLIKQARVNAYQSVNAELINAYWQVGEYISKRIADASWGDKTVDDLASYIQSSHSELKNFNRRGLYRMKQFYQTYYNSSLIVSAPRTQLQGNDNQSDRNSLAAKTINRPRKGFSQTDVLEITDIRGTLLAAVTWTNHRAIFSRCKTEEEREFYIRTSIQEKFNTRELDRQISTGLFERVMLGKTNLPQGVKELDRTNLAAFKDIYIFDFLNLPKDHNESDLQKALIAQMKDFVLELGKDFLFIGQEYRIQVGNSDFEIDILFYHRSLRCLVAFELKAEKFKPEHLGQLNFYLEALDQDVKKDHENPSIGILLCKDQDEKVVKYALNRTLSPALVAAYQTQLPDKSILQQKWRELFE